MAFTVSSISAGPYYVGDVVTVNVSDASASGKTLSIPLGSIIVDSEDASVMTFTVPDPKSFGNHTLAYDQAITFTATDGAESDTFSLSISPSVNEGHATITDPSGYATLGIAGLEAGDKVLAFWLAGGGTWDLTIGAFNAPSGAILRLWIQDATDGAWGTSGDITFAAIDTWSGFTSLSYVADTTAPVITLLGSATVDLLQGTPYTDQGATASDAEQGDLTGDIVVGGDVVDVNVTGTYTITYDVSDVAGNVATQVTRTINVYAVPLGTVTIDSITPSRTSAIAVFSYSGADVTGFEYSLDGASWSPASSPLSIGSLTEGTTYTLYVRPVLDGEPGVATTQGFTTNPAVDVTPNAFDFQDQTGVATEFYISSNTITVSGVDAGIDIPISVVDGEYSVSSDGGASWSNWTSLAGNVRLNYLVRTRHLSPSSYNTATTTSVTIGGVTDAFTSTTVLDTEPPSFTLTGGNVSVQQNSVWVEPGYAAVDNADGPIPANEVTIDSNVDTSTPGTYTITYSATDSAGNTGTASRIVTVTPYVAGDTTPPEISLVGGNITLTEGDSWVEPGYSATDNVDGVITGRVIVTGSVNTNTPGVYTLTYSVTDDAGLSASVSRSVTVLSAISYPVSHNAPDSRTFVAARQNRIEKGEAVFFKQPEEILDYDFDLAQWLAQQSDAIQPDSISVKSNSNLLEVVAFGQVSGTSRVKVWLAGGDSASYGKSHSVELTITTVNFRRATFLIRLVVFDKV